MSLDEIWQAVAADNPEARDCLARYERDLIPALGAALAAGTREQPPLPPAETRTKAPFATEFEIRKPASLVAGLADGPHQRTDLFRMLTPVRPEFRPALVRSLMDLAQRREENGDLEAAAAHLDEALDHGQQLSEADQDTTIARCLYERSRISLRLGRSDEALHRLREAATLTTADIEVALACARMRSAILKAISQIALQEGNQVGAVSYLTELADVLRLLAKSDPAELPDLAMTLNNLGTQRFKDDQAAGRAAVAEAVAIRRNLATADTRMHLPGLAAALNNLGFLSLRMRDLGTARSALAEAVEIRRGLATAEFGTYGSPLLRSLNNLVFVLLSQKPTLPGDLLEATAEARAVAEQLAAHDQGAMPDVALTLLHFAEARVLANRELDAAKAAVDSLLSAYGAQASAMGLLKDATALQQRLAAR
jgi:tetratricopeptide (TPR) repeat protein